MKCKDRFHWVNILIFNSCVCGGKLRPFCQIVGCDKAGDVEVNDLVMCSYHEEDMRLKAEAKYVLMHENE